MTVSDNPKNLLARHRVKLAYIPPVADAHMAHALMDGGDKYGPFNWREKKIALMEYVSAAKRHLDDFQDGEEVSDDALCHHLGHVMACCAIMLDAIELGIVIDDRPIKGNVMKVFKRIEATFSKVKAERDAAKAAADSAKDAENAENRIDSAVGDEPWSLPGTVIGVLPSKPWPRGGKITAEEADSVRAAVDRINRREPWPGTRLEPGSEGKEPGRNLVKREFEGVTITEQAPVEDPYIISGRKPEALDEVSSKDMAKAISDAARDFYTGQMEPIAYGYDGVGERVPLPPLKLPSAKVEPFNLQTYLGRPRTGHQEVQ